MSKREKDDVNLDESHKGEDRSQGGTFHDRVEKLERPEEWPAPPSEDDKE